VSHPAAFAASNLARRLSPADTEITVVNAEPDFVERMRLHQLAIGQDLAFRKLADVFAGTGVRGCAWSASPASPPSVQDRRRDRRGRRQQRSEGSGFDEACPDGVAGELQPVAQAEFLQEVRPVPVDGLDADEKDLGDLLGGVAFGHQLEHLLLSRRQDLVW
jgi:hypothetical protein